MKSILFPLYLNRLRRKITLQLPTQTVNDIILDFDPDALSSMLRQVLRGTIIIADKLADDYYTMD